LLVFLIAVEEPEAWEMVDNGIRHSMAINEELQQWRLLGMMRTTVFAQT
jgi:hypothetical protein